MTAKLIDTSAALADLCRDLQNSDCIAVDTEFARESTYYPHIGLIQIAGGDHTACIDPLAVDVSAMLAELFFNDRITKVFHACLQDLEVLELVLGGKPCPLFDTQIATALMHPDHQMSYARLVETELGVKLGKSETRTNWLHRPLTDAQLRYAADDVRFLLPLYRQQRDELAAMQRLHWVEEDCDALCSSTSNEADRLPQAWTRVKGKERLRGIELAILQQAAAWREQQAMAKDRTRRRILSDEDLVQIAIRRPGNASELARIGRIRRRLDVIELDSLADAVGAAIDLPESEWPSMKRRQLSASRSTMLKAVLEQVRATAAELDIAPGMLCNRRDAEKLVLGHRDLAVLRGWRLECIGDALLARVKGAA